MSGTVRNIGWRVTFAGMGINLALGVLYTWSVLSKGIPAEWNWSEADRALPYSISRWVAGDLVALGTDGFGRSDSRAALRAHFEVDSRHVVVAALGALARAGRVKREQVVAAMRRLDVDPEKTDPLRA